MFARRVYELMAINVYIISNKSLALERNFCGKYSGLEDDIPKDTRQICRENVDEVFMNHTDIVKIS